MHRITLMTKPDCRLCDDARNAIKRLVSAHTTVLIEEVNILKNPDLRAKYHDQVPVIIVDDVERFRGTFDPDKLAQLFYDEFGEKLLGF